MRWAVLLLVLPAWACSLMIPADKEPGDGTTDADVTDSGDGSGDTTGDDGVETDTGGDTPADTAGETEAGTCTPYEYYCEFNSYYQCDDDGTGATLIQTCTEGMICVESVGCVDSTPCSEAAARNSHLGCEFWAVSLPVDGDVDPAENDFGLIITNPDEVQDVNYTIYRDGASVVDDVIGPSSSDHVRLDILSAQAGGMPDDGWGSFQFADGAYEIITDGPVSVFQLQPREFSPSGSSLGHSGVSLLLPLHSLASSYIVHALPPASWDVSGTGPVQKAAYISVVAAATPDSSVVVSVTPTVTVKGGGGIGEIAGGTTADFTVNGGDVLHFTPLVPMDCDSGRTGHVEGTWGGPGSVYACDESVLHDLTGTEITGSQALAVFVGATGLNVPYDVWSADHVQEQVPPEAALGTEFFAAPLRHVDGLDNRVRVMGTVNGTNVNVSPEQAGFSYGVVQRGSVAEFTLVEPAYIETDHPVLVMQMTQGRYQTDPVQALGDPSIVFLVPQQQWDDFYYYEPPADYPGSGGQLWVQLVRHMSDDATMDGTPLTDPPWQTVGITSHQVWTGQITMGVHEFEGTGLFGLLVFGVGPGTGFATAGGTRLQSINP